MFMERDWAVGLRLRLKRTPKKQASFVGPGSSGVFSGSGVGLKRFRLSGLLAVRNLKKQKPSNPKALKLLTSDSGTQTLAFELLWIRALAEAWPGKMTQGQDFLGFSLAAIHVRAGMKSNKINRSNIGSARITGH